MQHWCMTLWTRFKLLFGRKVIAAPQDLQTFLETRSAYYVQKSITEYAQARANMIFSTLLGEKGFQDAYEAARWKAFPAGLAAVAEVLTGSLRERLGTDASAATLWKQRRGPLSAPIQLPILLPPIFGMWRWLPSGRT